MLNKFKYPFIVALAAVSLSIISSASAAIVPFAGALVSDSPTFDRPLSLTTLSTATTAHYAVFPFTVDTTGGYTLTMTAVGYDPFLLEYQTSFTPATPLTNLINGDDDYDPDGTGPLTSLNGSQIVATGGTAVGNFAATNTLTAGTLYYLVSTSFASGYVGTFAGTIDGPGTATLVPEPTTWAMLGLGVLGGSALRFRRKLA